MQVATRAAERATVASPGLLQIRQKASSGGDLLLLSLPAPVCMGVEAGQLLASQQQHCRCICCQADSCTWQSTCAWPFAVLRHYVRDTLISRKEGPGEKALRRYWQLMRAGLLNHFVIVPCAVLLPIACFALLWEAPSALW